MLIFEFRLFASIQCTADSLLDGSIWKNNDDQICSLVKQSTHVVCCCCVCCVLLYFLEQGIKEVFTFFVKEPTHSRTKKNDDDIITFAFSDLLFYIKKKTVHILYVICQSSDLKTPLVCGTGRALSLIISWVVVLAQRWCASCKAHIILKLRTK